MNAAIGYVVTTGFMGSGSSAATDLLREYSNVSCPNGSYEYVFLHCPGGVFDLEDKIIAGNNALRSDEALRIFRSTMLDLFENRHWWFGGYKEKVSPNFMRCVDEFIDSITTCDYAGFWYDHQKTSRLRSIASGLLKRLGLAGVCGERPYGDRMRVALPTSEEYYEAASQFVKNVIGELSLEGRVTLLDQLFLPHNLNRATRYLPEAKFIVVHRDPRDIFILNKYNWSKCGNPVPYPLDVAVYCDYYSRVMGMVPPCAADKVLQIYFEDLIIDYDLTVERIEEFVGQDIGSHVDQKRFLDPRLSARNIGVYLDEKEYSAESEIIATRLEGYLYPRCIDAVFAERDGHPF